MDNPSHRIIWWALMGALGVYGVIAFAMAPARAADAPASAGMVALALGGVSIPTALATLLLRAKMLVGPIQRGDLDPRRPEDRPRAAVGFVLCLVLTESIGLNGLVVALIAGQPTWSLPFLAVAALLLLAHRPSASDLQPPAGGPHAFVDSTPIV